MNKLFNTLVKNNLQILIVKRPFSCCKLMQNVDKNTVESLERLALVDFSTEAAIIRLEKSIQFADNLMEVDTSSVEPMISTVYEKNENIRADTVAENCNRKELMKIASFTEEFYYVAPLGTFSKKEESH